MYGVQARWNYFEAGHGKGPCDGLGGVAKRQAADAIKQNKACTRDAKDFFSWAKDNQKSINYRFYSSEEYESTSEKVMQMKLKPITGTMKLHAVFIDQRNEYTAETSCYCQECLTGLESKHCQATWTLVKRRETDYPNVPENMNTDDQMPRESQIVIDDLKLNQFVAALYENKWYIGQIKDIDLSDNTLHIKFMKETMTKKLQCFSGHRI